MISLIIPAFNEEKRISASLEKLQSFLRKRKEKFEVLLVDDASTDRTQEIAKSYVKKIPGFRVIRLDKSPYFGKGLAVNKGILEAKGEIVIFTDADFSTPIEEIQKLLDKLGEGFDVAIGSRALDRSSVKERQNPLRELMGRTFNLLVQNMTIKGFVDTQCGFKAFKMPKSRSLFEEQRIFDFGFDVEILYLARKKGLKIAEVSVLWFNDKQTKVNPIRDSFLMFLDLIKIRLYHSPADGTLLDKLFYLVNKKATFLKFGIVGVSNTVVDYILFFVLTRVVNLPALIANPISVESAIIWSFIWNNQWTFASREHKQPLQLRFLIFQIVQLGGLILSQTSLLLLLNFLGVNDLLAKAITIPLVMLFNYTLNNRWAFKDSTEKSSSWYRYIFVILGLLAFYLVLINILSLNPLSA